MLYKTHRNKRCDEEIEELILEFGDELDWDGLPIFDPKNPDNLFSEPKVWMKCQ